MYDIECTIHTLINYKATNGCTCRCSTLKAVLTQALIEKKYIYMCKFQLLYKVKILYYLPEMYMYLCIGLRLIVWCDCLNNGSSGKKNER